LLSSRRRVADPADADVFVVPAVATNYVFMAHIHGNTIDAEKRKAMFPNRGQQLMDYIKTTWPRVQEKVGWNNHVMIAPHDFGASVVRAYVPETRNFTFLTVFGYTGVEGTNNEHSGYPLADDLTGFVHPAAVKGRDIVVPDNQIMHGLEWRR
jgi:hypothetical protein